ncbi:MAG: phage tail family protein [Lachnospiraceae bacterium]|nr:phage tail family protein [Lachnospiraceae bacterium]
MKYPVVEINGIDMLKKYKAILGEQHSVQPPVPKTFYQDVPGADGSADLSTAISGRITYNRRVITMNFQCEHKDNQWTTVMSEILKEFHGKEGKIVFGDDPAYYYFGRMEVSGYERSRTYGKFTITVNAEPYKYEQYSSLDPWLWDPFNFQTGVICYCKDIAVDGTKILNIHGTERWAIPVFITEGNIKVTFGGETYDLQPGRSKIYSIVIEPGMNTFQFTGKGTVSVEYRGGKL